MGYEKIQGNRHRGNAFRNAVLLYLHAEGHDEAVPIEHTARKLSEMLREDPADIEGLPWALTVQSGREQDLSTDLNEACDSAHASGKPYAASIRSRRGYPIQQSYVVMTLDTFSDVLHLTTAEALDTEPESQEE